ncbi:N-acetylmuramoyl-L-alanine amidase [Virgibacillus subterraneus]|uniref:N-acetylmuramoyl-L-alanine amidase n=1 Tax=Virgibacillus subterraneus TaxID=621109 RepID=A0A1H8ZWK9_9BACI|nr:N-acetylmuramoyl-L-alanine amidase [Virgibacillus subterraneus]SEP68840.1 N-acetylmuramoyl-L-alanine amidase [Virgibacillus subterraneus]
MKQNQTVTIVGVFLLLLLVFIPSVHADSGQTYEVGTDSLNVRSAPAHSAEVIGQLNDGDRVVVFDKAFGWVQTYYNGQEAWVASDYLFAANGVTSVNQKEITVIADEVRLRTGPGTQHKILGYASSGDTYTMVKTSNKWNKIMLNDGSIAWIASWLTNANGSNHPAETSENHNHAKKQSSGSLAGYNIVLDPGHGGKDPGAIGIGGTFEKGIIMDTADNVAKQLRDAGATVILTREDDYFIPLEERVRISNAYNTHAFISLHYNAYPSLAINGVSTYFHSGGDDRVLAGEVQSAIAQKVPLKNRGVMQKGYHVLRENNDLSVLIELGFITNPYDLDTVRTAEYHNNVAAGVVEGLKNYFNE